MLKIQLFFTLVTLNLVFPAVGFAQTIEGDWQLTQRKCESAKSWEAIDNVIMSINLETNTHSLTWLESSCTLLKIGSIQQPTDAKITFCRPVAHAVGSCDQRILDHVNDVNALESECTDERNVVFTKSGNEMMFSETIKNPGFACPVGEDLLYTFQRAL
jgi:hypothetical protein